MSITFKESLFLLTKVVMVLTHCWQELITISAPVDSICLIFSFAISEERSGSIISRFPPPPQQRHLSLLSGSSINRIPGIALIISLGSSYIPSPLPRSHGS